jgi:hypothetical protein
MLRGVFIAMAIHGSQDVHVGGFKEGTFGYDQKQWPLQNIQSMGVRKVNQDHLLCKPT